jgi:D-psicose/D-tagatose/L-ribulose 3-epimerase
MNMLLWTTHVTEADYPHLKKIKEAGFDGIEVPLFEGDAAHFKKLRKVLDDLGLAASAVTVSGADANPISPEAEVRKRAVEDLRRKIEFCAILGADVLAGPYHQPLGVFSGNGPTPDEKRRAAEVHRAAAEEARKVGVTLTIEYLNRFECYFLNTARDAALHVERVDHPSFKTMYDTFHANIEEKDPIAAFSDNARHIAHFHVSENDRGTPGKGHVPWLETFRAVRRSGYDGWLTIEAFGRALPDLAAATRVWRDFFPSRDEVYTEGIRFIRETWRKAAA